MERELRRLRSRIASALVGAKGHRRFEPELRAEIVEYARRRVAEDESQRDIAAELGIGARLLSGWLRGAGAPLREVVVELEDLPRPERRERRLVMRSGVELVGLEVDELIAIAKALS